MAIKYFDGIDGKKYMIAGGRTYRIIRDDEFTIIGDIRRIEEIDWGKIKKVIDIYKKLYKAVKWKKRHPKKKSYYTMTRKAESIRKKIWDEYSNEFDNLFPGYSPKGGFLLNLQYVKNSTHWHSLWHLIKQIKIFGMEYETIRKFRWGELSGAEEEMNTRNYYMWRRNQELKKEGKSPKQIYKIIPREIKKLYHYCPGELRFFADKDVHKFDYMSAYSFWNILRSRKYGNWKAVAKTKKEADKIYYDLKNKARR